MDMQPQHVPDARFRFGLSGSLPLNEPITEASTYINIIAQLPEPVAFVFISFINSAETQVQGVCEYGRLLTRSPDDRPHPKLSLQHVCSIRLFYATEASLHSLRALRTGKYHANERDSEGTARYL
jgi:hypothetical protein